MLGAVFGALAVIGVIKLARRAYGRRHGYGFAMGCGVGYGGWSRRGGMGGRRYDGYDAWEDDAYDLGGGRGGTFLRVLFDRLEATPAQERVIRNALSTLRAKARDVKGDVRGARGDLATSFRGESLDAESLGVAAHRATSAVDSMRDALIGALVEVHAALDPRQRGILADALERGPRGLFRARRGGPYRAWVEA